MSDKKPRRGKAIRKLMQKDRSNPKGPNGEHYPVTGTYKGKKFD